MPVALSQLLLTYSPFYFMKPNKPYLYIEYKYVNKKKVFKGFACGINGTSRHAIFNTRKEAVQYNNDSYKEEINN